MLIDDLWGLDMQFSTVFVALAVYAGLASAARVQFYTQLGCPGAASEDYQNVQCNSCVDPPGGALFHHIYALGVPRPHP